MFIKALIAAFILLAISQYLINQKWKWSRLKISESRKIKLLLLIGFLFMVFGYAIPNIYYLPVNNGVTGDNYLHMHWALSQNNYIKNLHMLFPLAGKKFVDFILANGLLKNSDPYFLEKAFWLSAVPVKAATILALMVLSFSYYKDSKNPDNTTMLFFLLATSYSVWVWAIQSNALGLTIATEIFCVAFFAHWYKTRKTLPLVFLSFFTGLGMFVHNGFIYFAIGMAFSVIIATIIQHRISKRTKYLHLAFFSGITMAMAMVFYLIEAKINNTYNISTLFDILSDRPSFGPFTFKNTDWSGAFESNLWAGVNWFSNFDHNSIFKTWAPEHIQAEFGPGITILRALQWGSMAAILIVIIYSGIKKRSKPTPDLFIPGALTSLFFLAGFTVRQAATHYYTLAAVPNMILILSFVLSENIDLNVRRTFSILITLLILLNAGYNTFTRMSVFQGSNINDHPYYAETIKIYNTTAGKEAVYFRDLDITYYPNMAMAEYYRPKFGHIKWIPQAGSWDSKKDLMLQIQLYAGSDANIFLGPKANAMISRADSLDYERIDDQIIKLIR